MDELRELVLDIFERAYETSSLSNKDAQNIRCHDDNMARLLDMGGTSPFDADDVEGMLWPNILKTYDALSKGTTDPKVDPHELAAAGERKHRRYAALEYLEDRFRENPDLFHQMIRRPLDPNPFYDRRMPALMKGADTGRSTSPAGSGRSSACGCTSWPKPSRRERNSRDAPVPGG